MLHRSSVAGQWRRPPQATISTVDARIELRGLGPDDVEYLTSRFSRGGWNDFGELDADRKGIEEMGRLAVTRAGGDLIGSVSWRLSRYGPNRGSRAWNIGIELIPEARGQGFGSEAQRALALHLFATSDVDRVEASTDIENVAEQRALEKAGFKREGVLRSAQYRPGGRHDLVVFSMLRTDIGA
jgi:RimJ/RimL family protein N-acetyltransferase